MALINCSECDTQISDKAVACIKCGNPITAIFQSSQAQTVVIDKKSKTQTIEATGKTWKAAKVLGILMFLYSFVVIFGQNDPNNGTILLIGGLAIWIGAKIGAWWKHG